MCQSSPKHFIFDRGSAAMFSSKWGFGVYSPEGAFPHLVTRKEGMPGYVPYQAEEHVSRAWSQTAVTCTEKTWKCGVSESICSASGCIFSTIRQGNRFHILQDQCCVAGSRTQSVDSEKNFSGRAKSYRGPIYSIALAAVASVLLFSRHAPRSQPDNVSWCVTPDTPPAYSRCFPDLA